MLPEKALLAFKAEVEHGKDWFPGDSTIEIAIFRLMLYVKGPMAFDPDAMENGQAMNAFENGVSLREIRYFFNSYPDDHPSDQDKDSSACVKRRERECASWLDGIRVLFQKEELVDLKLFERKHGWLTESAVQTRIERMLRKGVIRWVRRGRYSVSDSFSKASITEGYKRLLRVLTMDQLSPHNRPVELLFIYDTPREQLKEEAEWLDEFEKEVVQVAAAFDERIAELYELHTGKSARWEGMPSIFFTPTSPAKRSQRSDPGILDRPRKSKKRK